MKHNIFNAIVSVYFVGIFCMWAYLMAWAIHADNETIYAAILGGWVAGLVWPLVSLVWAMSWFFFSGGVA